MLKVVLGHLSVVGLNLFTLGVLGAKQVVLHVKVVTVLGCSCRCPCATWTKQRHIILEFTLCLPLVHEDLVKLIVGALDKR